MDRGMNDLLKWSIQNTPSQSGDSNAGSNTQASESNPRGLNADALRALMGGPSDADLMLESMAAIKNPEVSLENKLVAFDNFEQFIENLDNANNMESLKLWSPLVSVLDDEEAELRRFACWCIGTAVQNNIKSQERVSHHPSQVWTL